MYVHNYVPEPLEVPGNVTQERYPLRLAFIRKVSLIHATSALGVAAMIPFLPAISFGRAMYLWLALTLILAVLRITFRGVKPEVVATSALFPLLLVAVALVIRAGLARGWPIWSAGIGLSCAVIYAMLCGRDFSFVGQFLLALIVSSMAIAYCDLQLGLMRGRAAEALAWNAAYLFYYVYDLASLMARRRIGEEFAAAADLYRDVVNIFGYIVRVIAHWRRHRIWTLPARWS